MNIQKVIALITLMTGLSIFSITTVNADPRKQQYVIQYESHHQYKKKHYENRYNNYRQARKIRHERSKRVANYPHQKKITVARPHKSLRKSYTKPHRKNDRRTYYRSQRNYSRYSFNSYWH